MIFRSRVMAAAMVAAFLIPSAALAQSTVTLNEGDELHIVMQDTLDSGKAYVGQHFSARVIPPFPEGDYDLDNALVTGKVIKVVPAGQGVNPELHLSFTTITLANGTSYP